MRPRPWCIVAGAILGCATFHRARAQTDSAAAPRAAGVFTEAQAARGEAAFRRTCAQCHVASQFATPAFRRSWEGRPLFELFELIRTTMPNDNPGRLPRQAYADVVAYLCRLNGVTAGAAELPTDADSLRRIHLQPAPDPRH